MIAVAVQKSDISPSKTNSTRYWSARRIDARSCTARRRKYRAILASVCGVAREASSPHEERDPEEHGDPRPLNRELLERAIDGLHPDHRLHGKRQRVAKRHPGRRGAEP